MHNIDIESIILDIYLCYHGKSTKIFTILQQGKSNKLFADDMQIWRIEMRKCVITVVGKDTVGIIAKVCSYLADTKINILDISQTIVSGYFNMMMIVDTTDSVQNFDEVISSLDKIGEEIGVSIKCQREEIFDMMHRI